MIWPLLLAGLCAAARATPHLALHARERQGISHIIHQSWKDENVPADYQRWTRTWREKHPDWELWTDADNDALVNDHYPWFKDTYDSLPQPVMKADAVRPLYMHRYGGVYADLDFEALRNLEPLLEGHTGAVLAAMDGDRDFDHSVPNAWLASSRHHPFWLFVLQTIIRTAGKGDMSRADWVEATTGPVMLHTAIKAFQRANGTGLTILDPGTIYAINWRQTYVLHQAGPEVSHLVVCDIFNKHFDEAACKALFPDAYAVTWWSHSWAPPGYRR